MEKTINKKSDRGITLIALIIMIVLIIILSAVAIRGMSGRDGLLKTAEIATEDYTKSAYEEQIEQKIRATILKYATRGEEASIVDIAKELNEETEWVKLAMANKDLENADILVITTDGKVYEVYYNNIYGIMYMEYIGEDDGKAFPSIKAKYDNESGNIYAEAKVDEGSISKVELIYRGEILGEPANNPEGEITFNVKTSETGWYKIKATASTGKVRYAWVKKVNISKKLKAPEIRIETEGELVNGWYGADKKELNAVISTDSPYAKEIHYTLSGAIQKEEVVEISSGSGERSISIPIDVSGVTRVVATIEDGEGNSSNYSIEDIKYDKELPVIESVQVIGTQGKEEWYTGKVEIKIITDAVEAAYYYKVTDKEGNVIQDKTRVETVETGIRLERDGEYKIEIELEDSAGNKSEPKEINIKRDTEAPILQEAKADAVTITKDSFKLSASAGDRTSQIAYYEFYLDGVLVEKGENPTYTIRELTEGTEYQAQVKVYDRAGLSTTSVNIPVTTMIASQGGTESTNRAPVYIDGPKENGKTATSVTLKMAARDDDGDAVTYNITYGTYNSNGSQGNALGTKEIKDASQGVSQEITISGLSTYTTYYFTCEAVDSNGNTNGPSSLDVRTYCNKATQCAGNTNDIVKVKCTTCSWTWSCPSGRSATIVWNK